MGDRVGRDDRRNAAEDAPPELPTLRSQPSSLVVGQPQTPSAELLLEDPILFDEVLDGPLLLPVDPAGDRE